MATEVEKEVVKNRIYEYFGDKNKATRKELTEYMSDLWKGNKEQINTNNLIGKILNEEMRNKKFTKARGEGNQLVFTLKGRGLKAEELVEEELEAELDDKVEDLEEIEEEIDDELVAEEELEEEADEPNKLDEVLEETEVVDDDEEKAMTQYEEETGKSAITSAKTLRKAYQKWKINNWD